MSDSVRDILRRAGRDDKREQEQKQWREVAQEAGARDEPKSEVEKRHDRYRFRQEQMSKLGPAGERLPILSREEQVRREQARPERRQIQFEGTIEKLIEKYKDPKEVFNHLSMGQLMKYQLNAETGCIYEKGELIFDGKRLVRPKK